MPNTLDLYERDFVRWSEEQAAALRAASSARIKLPLDWEHLAEEIDSLGKSLRSELRNRMATVIEHLLKLHASPAMDPRAGWLETVDRERVEIETILDENPSLRGALQDSLESADRKARKLVALSLRNHGKWNPDIERELADISFSEADIMGPGYPASRSAPL